jgi:hypothetical protein
VLGRVQAIPQRFPRDAETRSAKRVSALGE